MTQQRGGRTFIATAASIGTAALAGWAAPAGPGSVGGDRGDPVAPVEQFVRAHSEDDPSAGRAPGAALTPQYGRQRSS